MTPRPVQHGGGVKGPGAERPSVLRVRADGGSRLFTAKLGVVVHYLPHQLIDHLLPDDPSVSKSGATGETKKAAQRFSAIGR